jgi:hypothetical protein
MLGPDLGAHFEDADADYPAAGRRELLQPYRSGEAGRAAADDDHIVFHRFARHAAIIIHVSCVNTNA